MAPQVARGVVLADAAHGVNAELREGLTLAALQHDVGAQGSLTV